MIQSKERNTLGGEAVRLTISKVVTAAISMVMAMLLSRFRTTEEYGTYSQMLLVINLVSSLMMLGLPNSINYFLGRAETQEERRSFLSVYYSLSTVLSIVIGTVLVLAIPLIEGYFHNPLIGNFYYYLALFPWTSIICSSIENILVVYHQTKFLVAYRVFFSLASLGVIVVIQLLGFGFTTFMIAYVVENCVFALAVYIIASKLAGGIKPNYDKQLIKNVFSFSIPIGLSAVVGTLNAEIDKLLIGYLLNTDQMAIYTNAAKELPFSLVATSITAVLLPQLSRMMKDNKHTEAVRLWGYASELALIIILLIVFGVFVFAEDVITILYSTKYIAGVNVFRIYTLNLILRITYFGIILNAAGETKKIFWCSIYSLVLNAILNPLFYWTFGMIGPAIATFIAILAIQLLQLRMTSQITNISFATIFPWRRLSIILVINIGFAITFYIIKCILPLEIYMGSILESLVLGGIWTALYLIIMRKKILHVWHALNHGELA